MSILKASKQALAYATFSSPEVKEAFETFLNTVDSDLDVQGYEPGEKVENTAESLKDTLNEADVTREDAEDRKALTQDD